MSDSRSRDRLEELDTRFRAATAERQRGNLVRAEAGFRDLADCYSQGGWLDRSAMALINLSQVLQRAGRLQEAEQIVLGAMSTATEIGDDRRTALCLGGLATIKQEQGDQEECERYINDALSAFRRLEDSVGIGNQLGNLGLLRQNQGRMEDALRCFQEAAENFAAGGNANGAIGVLQCLGELHRRQGEYDEAQGAHVRALALAQQQKNRLAEANSERALGQLARARGSLEQAMHRISKGLAIHQEMGDSRGELSSLVDLGTVYFALGKGAEAIDCLTDCIGRARDKGLVGPLTKALLNRALYQLDTDQIQAVEADLAEAHSLLDKLGDEAARNVWSVTSARCKIRIAEWDEAALILENELERAQRANLGAVRAPILGLLASVEATRGRPGDARQLLVECEALYRAAGDFEGVRMALTKQAYLLAESGALEQGRQALDSLLAGLPAGEHPLLEAEALAVSAAIFDLTEEYDQAITVVTIARERFEEAGFQIASIRLGLCETLYLLRRQRSLGDELPSGLASRAENLLERAQALKAPTLAIAARTTLAECLAEGGEKERALDLLGEALEAARECKFPNGEAEALEALARVQEDRHTAALAVHKLRALQSQARAERLRREWSLTETEIEAVCATEQ